jgi:riboflavin synthase
MFTGLIRHRGEMLSRQGNANGERIVIALHEPIPELEEGDSLAVNGVCLTVIDLTPQRFCADLSSETLSLTTLGQLYAGETVNLEPSLSVGDSIDGHMVSGHVDAIGHVRRVQLEDQSARVWINAPAALMPLIAPKGSVAVDGVSLTVNEVDAVGFRVQLIPHTRQTCTLGELKSGKAVNLEADMLARYVFRALQTGGPGGGDKIA